MVAYKDFIPISPGIFMTQERIKAGFDSAVWSANEWIGRESISVLNVETINSHSMNLPILLRVWYHVDGPTPISFPED